MGRGFESLCRYQKTKKHLRHCDLSQVLFVFPLIAKPSLRHLSNRKNVWHRVSIMIDNRLDIRYMKIYAWEIPP